MAELGSPETSDRDLAQAGLKAALARLPELFVPAALGYLTATAKVEGPVRDALAVDLHTQLSGHGLQVAREWGSRVDLAVTRDAEPVLEVEAKALYTLDVLTPGKNKDFLWRRKGHGGDVLKMKPAIDAGRACYLLSLVTHLDGLVPTKDWPVIKYASLHNGVARRFASGQAMSQAACRWTEDLAAWGNVADERDFELGEVYEVGVALRTYLVGPLGDQALTRLSGLIADGTLNPAAPVL